MRRAALFWMRCAVVGLRRWSWQIARYNSQDVMKRTCELVVMSPADLGCGEGGKSMLGNKPERARRMSSTVTPRLRALLEADKVPVARSRSLSAKLSLAICCLVWYGATILQTCRHLVSIHGTDTKLRRQRCNKALLAYRSKCH